MAFDSVFQGPPSDVAAPGTAQSPSLGVDVTNKELYISSGNGWEEISSGGSGTISGSGTTGSIPKFTAAEAIGNSNVDEGVTLDGYLTVNESLQILATEIIDTAIEGLFVSAQNNTNADVPGEMIGIELLVGNNGTGVVDVASAFQLDTVVNTGTINFLIGLAIQDQTAGTQNWAIQTGLGLVEFGDNVKFDKLLEAGTLYSAAGTPLPAASIGLKGARATVSDATATTFFSTYTSGGTNTVPVFCTGTAWVIA